MKTRGGAILVALVMLTTTLVTQVGTAPQAEAAVRVRAGVAVVDSTWHVGASAGQYASDALVGDGAAYLESLASGDLPDPESAPRPQELVEFEFDPNAHSIKRAPSWGVQSRLTVRAIVVEGPDGTRIALLKSDNYLAQDVLLRRVGQLLANGRSGVAYDRIMHHATHNHSSPSYTTPAWGVWVFQDVMDLRMLEYQARAMAQAIERAAANLRPARMGATTVQLGGIHRNAPGPAIADDGSPTGYPRYFNDEGLVVMRFDDLTDPDRPKPLATWTNYGVHPESLDGHDLISADYLGPLERMVGRATGVPLVFSQGGVGSSEPVNDPSLRLTAATGEQVVRAFSHRGYAQAERKARLMADAVIQGWEEIGAGRGAVPYSSDFPVAMISRWTPGPVSHPYPSVSNCRTESTVAGDIGIPVLGLPDCFRTGAFPDNPVTPEVWAATKLLGIPLPDNYDAPSFTAVEENLRIYLQVVRLGEVLLASCACEAQVDLILNLESRANKVVGDIWNGYPWDEHCDRAGANWRCADPRADDLSDRSLPVTNEAYQRMKAQVHNDARGWDDPAYAPFANAEPVDPREIKGNFTKEELPPRLGYTLPVGIGHAGDYNGYTVSYRMYQSYDHYRKALTSHGPHTADYMVTRLVRMAAQLKGGPPLPPEPLDALGRLDEVRQETTARALGVAAAVAYDHWRELIPSDNEAPAILRQPQAITRFDAATFSWRGGNNYVDNPVVRVERSVRGRWEPWADQSGEIQTMVQFPTGAQSVATQHLDQFAYVWTANFEAANLYPSDIDPRGATVPDGRYRFVVHGKQLNGRRTVPYRLVSNPFRVSPWEGLRVQSVDVVDGGAVAVTVADPVYPRTYRSPFRFIADDNGDPICETCTFRPWAATGRVESVIVTVDRLTGARQRFRATQQDGRWVAPVRLGLGDRAFVDRGGVQDSYGEINGQASGEVRR